MVTGHPASVHEHGGCRTHHLRCTLDQRPPIRGQRHVAPYRNWETNPRVASGFIVRDPAGFTSEQAIHGTARHLHAESFCRRIMMGHPNDCVDVDEEDALT